MADDSSQAFLEGTRFWVQRVLVPVLVLVGSAGNIVTVMVLTKRHMRCSTHVYLTALAVADLIYLLLTLILSFKHYPNITDYKYELYWRFYGISHWFVDAASYTSIWLIASFTIERYIAVCHPIRGKVLCTETRAKRVISAVALFCVLTTMSTTFEYQLGDREKCNSLRPCNGGDYDSIVNYLTGSNASKHNGNGKTKPCLDDHLTGNQTGQTKDIAFLPKEVTYLLLQLEDAPDVNSSCYGNTCLYPQPGVANNVSALMEDLTTTKRECCIKKHTIVIERTQLGKNEVYLHIFFWFSSVVFVFLPLLLIAIFNSFLIHAVKKSQQERQVMTNSQLSQDTQSQENRITLILISVVVLALICQTPSACLLIVSLVHPNGNNILMGLGNIFNLLVAINAACNFLLYCVLSDKYRRTFKALFCAKKRKKQNSSSFALSSTRVLASRTGASLKRNASEYASRHGETQRLTSLPRTKSLHVRNVEQS